MKISVGDRVRFKDYEHDGIGIVIDIDHAIFAVESESLKGHTCGGMVKSCHGWWFTEDELTFIPSIDTAEAAAYYHALMGVS